MIIKKVVVEKEIKNKIFDKHGIYTEEIKNGLFYGKPIFYRTKDERYMAVTNYHRYITLIFIYEKNNAHIITAYPSSKWQIKLYKKKN